MQNGHPTLDGVPSVHPTFDITRRTLVMGAVLTATTALASCATKPKEYGESHPLIVTRQGDNYGSVRGTYISSSGNIFSATSNPRTSGEGDVKLGANIPPGYSRITFTYTSANPIWIKLERAGKWDTNPREEFDATSTPTTVFVDIEGPGTFWIIETPTSNKGANLTISTVTIAQPK